MIEQRSQELVVGCLAASAAVAAGASLASGTIPGLRLVIGVAFTGVGLATVSMVAPELAGSFAVLILTSTVFLYGGPLWDSVTAFTATAKPQTTPTPSTTRPQPSPPKGSLSA